MEIVTYRIEGISPILQNNPEAIAARSNGPELSAKRKHNAEEMAAQLAIKNDRGELIIGTACFRAALLAASVGRKIGKASARSIVAASVFPIEENAILLDRESGKPITKYEVHRCRAVVQRNGILRCRPLVRNWATLLAVEVDLEMLPDVDLITQLLCIAGRICGVGDWRVNKGGTFGRFSAKLVA